jgi:hypothetical protein
MGAKRGVTSSKYPTPSVFSPETKLCALTSSSRAISSFFNTTSIGSLNFDSVTISQRESMVVGMTSEKRQWRERKKGETV